MGSVFVCLVATAIRFGFWGSLTDPWWCLLVEGLHGVMFGLMWATGVSYARSVAPDGMGATMQGFYTGWMFGGGGGSGSLIAGAVASAHGLRVVFWGMALYAAGTALLIPLLFGLGLMGAPNKAEDSFYQEFDGAEMMGLDGKAGEESQVKEGPEVPLRIEEGVRGGEVEREGPAGARLDHEVADRTEKDHVRDKLLAGS
mmetsp:Transcript_46249/g.92466  ORF Transcript_46249/g.92466 Transcript_46249/m.92466 type:complete len:200 (+) Transcript_46249:225-824(+)